MVAEAGGLEGLLRLLNVEELPRREAAADALATLMSDDAGISARVARSPHVTAQLLPLLKSRSALVRFLGAKCLINLAAALPSTSAHVSQSAEVRPLEQASSITGSSHNSCVSPSRVQYEILTSCSAALSTVGCHQPCWEVMLEVSALQTAEGCDETLCNRWDAYSPREVKHSCGVMFLTVLCMRRQEVRSAVLPVLAKLLGEEEVREEVPHVLSLLLADRKELQAAAADADAISKLARFLRMDGCSQRLKVLSPAAASQSR